MDSDEITPTLPFPKGFNAVALPMLSALGLTLGSGVGKRQAVKDKGEFFPLRSTG